jgi:hypothetical protein
MSGHVRLVLCLLQALEELQAHGRSRRGCLGAAGGLDLRTRSIVSRCICMCVCIAMWIRVSCGSRLQCGGRQGPSGVKWSSTRCRSRAPSSSQCSTTVHPPSPIALTGTRPPPTSPTAPLGPATAQHALHVPERPLPCASTRFPFWRVLRSRRMSEPVAELARAIQGGGAGAAKCQSWLPIPHLAWQTDAAPSQLLAPPRAPMHGPSHPNHLPLPWPDTIPPTSRLHNSTRVYLLRAIHLAAVTVAATMCRCYSSSFIN